MTIAFSSWRRSYAYIAGATLALVVASDYFLYGHTLGWTTSIVALALLAALATRNVAFLKTTGGRWCPLRRCCAAP